MKDLEQMLELLEQKRLYFLHYEKEMEALPYLPAEDMEACVERGGLIVEKIRETEGRLGRLVKQNGPLAISAVNHECERGQLPPDLGKLYDASMAVKAVAVRIMGNDDLIRRRIAWERDQAMERLKELNSRSQSIAGRYQRSTQTGVTGVSPDWTPRNA